MTWESIRLENVAKNIQTGPFGSQLHQSDYSDIGIPVIMPKDIVNGKIYEESIARVSEEHVERLSKHKVKHGDILYSRRGDIGRCAYADSNNVGWLCGTGCLRVTIDSQKANPKFIFYSLQCQECIGWVINHAVGSTMLNLNTSILSNIPLSIPSLEIQNKIVNILSAYDDLIANNQKQIKLLEEAAQRLYKEWFIDLHFPGHEDCKIVDGVPEGWRKELLTDIAEIQYGFSFDGSTFNSEKKGHKIIRIRNIPDSTTKDYTTQTADDQYIVHNGDIVVGMDGEFHINSWSGGDAYLVQRTCSFRPHDETMKGYLLQAIYEPIKFFEKTLVGATVAHLGKKNIDTIRLLIPPPKYYQQFEKGYKLIQNLREQNILLQEARDRLLPKLMSGEIEL